MQLISPDELKEHGFTVPPTFNIGNPYITVRAEDTPVNNNGLCRRFFVNDEIIDAIPTINAEPIKHGRWINVKISISGNSSAECSLCGAVVHSNFSNVINYCPNCGARMDGEENGI